MNIREFDWRIGPLHDVIVGIGAGLAAIQEQMEEEGLDELGALDHAEPLLGLGFVAVQTYALGTVADLNKIRGCRGAPSMHKNEYYSRDPVKVREEVTRIQLVSAVANYFKHHDEWLAWPRGKDPGSNDVRILACIGITEKTAHPCVEAANLLCGKSWEMIVLHQIVKEWREHLVSNFA